MMNQATKRPWRHLIKSMAVALPMLLLHDAARAAGPPQPSSMSDPLVITMVILMIILLMGIGLLANALLSLARYKQEQDAAEKNKTTGAAGVGLLIIGLLASIPGMAQDAAASVTSSTGGAGIAGLSSTAFYFMIGVILLECLVMLVLALQLKSMLARERSKAASKEEEAAIAAKPKENWWTRMNRLKPVEQEASLDLGHDYDGIRELDNRLPPWWLWGFYITIVFAVVYLWRFHVSHTAPLSAEEYQIAVKKAEADQQEYLKHAANLVDENTVKLLTDAADINAGKSIFQQNCTPCHGGAGEGNTVGPNLTDDYWLHGGSIHDVFRSIKYGWQEKGMKSWKDDFTPSQIAQIASYVKSLHGSHPPNSKPPQGELYKEAAASDSSGTAVNAASN